MDCVFFFGDCFKRLPLVGGAFVTYCFDDMPEPEIAHAPATVIRPHHACTDVLQRRNTNGRWVFTLAKRWPFIQRVAPDPRPERYLSEENILISDIPDDYLHLYANTSATYSDRVHACIATLAFGNAARLFLSTPRAHLFDRVGAGDITQRLVRLDMDRLRAEKARQVDALRAILEEVEPR